MAYSAVLQSTVGARRAATAAAVNRPVGAAWLSAIRRPRQTRPLAHTSSMANVPIAAKTIGQPNNSAVTRPIGAPSERDIKRPDTTMASQVARRSDGAL